MTIRRVKFLARASGMARFVVQERRHVPTSSMTRHTYASVVGRSPDVGSLTTWKYDFGSMSTIIGV
jgi:hypothetical protein